MGSQGVCPLLKQGNLESERVIVIVFNNQSEFPSPLLLAMGDGSMQRKVFINEDDRRDPLENEFSEWFQRAEKFVLENKVMDQFFEKEKKMDDLYENGEIDLLEYFEGCDWDVYYVD